MASAGRGTRKTRNTRRLVGLTFGEAPYPVAGGAYCYQLCNRVAWAWNLADLGVPVVLVYLSFLNAAEMLDQGQPFSTAQMWEDCLRHHAQGLVRETAWGGRLDVLGTLLGLLVRSVTDQQLG